MANLNKVMLIGRLTRDPEAIELRGAIEGAKFGFAVNNRKKNNATGQWEDVPVWIDCEIWNRGENKQGQRLFDTVRKGHQIYLEGVLKMDQWEDKNGGGKRSKLLVVVDTFQYLESKGGGGEDGGERQAYTPRAASSRSAPPARQAPAASSRNGGGYAGYDDDDDRPSSRSGGGGHSNNNNEDDIPF